MYDGISSVDPHKPAVGLRYGFVSRQKLENEALA
jgi:hypothetical protein